MISPGTRPPSAGSGVAAASYTVATSTLIEAVTPSGSAGIVTTTAGASRSSKKTRFTLTAETAGAGVDRSTALIGRLRSVY